MRVVTFANLKGGVSKTTTVHNTAFELVKKGYTVLCIDDDPQCNLTLVSGVNPNDENLKTLEDIFEAVRLGDDSVSVNTCITPTNQGYDLIAGSLNLVLADLLYGALPARSLIISNMIEELEKAYDFVMIDTSPSIGLLTQNALLASDDLIVPLNADAWSLQGTICLANVLKKTEKSFKGIGKTPKIGGLLVTMYGGRTNNEKQMLEGIHQMADKLGAVVFDTHIRRTVKVREAQSEQSSVIDYDKNSTAAVDYLNFTEEFLRFEKEAEHGKTER